MSAAGGARDLDKAALRGEPSYVWRAGQERRLGMILASAGERVRGRVLENGCGVGMYAERLFAGLPLRVVEKTVIFGAYDNIIARYSRLGRGLRRWLQALEKTPLRLGLSHYWVGEKE